MKSKWKVTTNQFDEKRVYGVYRQLDTTEIDHSGNREMRGDYMDSKEEAERIARELNERDAASDMSNQDH